MSKAWLWVVVPALVIGGAWAWSALRPAATVETVTPTQGQIRAFIEERAVTELPDDHLIYMPIDGWLQQIRLREGDPVSQNQVIGRLDTEDLKDRVRQAEQRLAVLETQIKETSDHRLENHMLAETEGVVKAMQETVQAAEAQLEGSLAIFEFARSEVERLKQLSESNAATVRELSEAKTEYRKTGADHRSNVLELAALRTLWAVSQIGPRFIADYIDRKSFELETYHRQLDEARLELEILQRNLERAVVTCPIDGVVLQRHQTRRQFLPAGTPLLTVGNLDELEIIVEVLTERATRVSPGDPVEVFGEALGPEVLQGRVLRVYPAGFKKISSLGVEQQRVKVAVKLDARPPRLGVGFRADVRIIYDREDTPVLLPRTCLFRSAQGSWQVLVAESGRLALRTVGVGIMNDDQVQITEGVSPGDRVVLHPSKDLEPGLRVRVTQAGARS